MNENAAMQREAAPIPVAGMTLEPLTLPRMNAASAMRISVFSLDETQRKELRETKTYRGIIRDIIIVFYLCSHTRETADKALWNPDAAMAQASAFAEKHGISEAAHNFVEMQFGFWMLINPIFENDAVPASETELGPAKKKGVAT